VCRLSHTGGRVPQSCITMQVEWAPSRFTTCGDARPYALGVFVPPGPHIFIVEPDELIRELLERWLGEAGYQTVTVNQDHVLPMVKPRLVITDISEPGSGGDTIEALRTAYGAPILLLSARFRRGLGGSIEPAQRLRVEKVLPKPFTRQQLLRAVREALNNA